MILRTLLYTGLQIIQAFFDKCRRNTAGEITPKATGWTPRNHGAALPGTGPRHHSAMEPSRWRHTGFFQLWGVRFSSSTSSRLTSTPIPGFTGSRTGRKAALTPVVKNGTTVYETVKNADGSDRLYPDSTGQQRYEFLDQSKTVIPGSKVSSYTSMDAGDNSKFFDGDLDSRSRQQVLVGAPLVGNQPDRVTELTYGRDWYSMLAKDRTYGQVALAGVKPEDGEYVNKGVETSMHWDETGDVGDWLPVTDEDAGVGLKENILWAEDSLHLRMPWLYTATRFVTERYYAGDINGDYDQYDTRLTGSALESMQGRSVYFADEKLRVYTPGMAVALMV